MLWGVKVFLIVATVQLLLIAGAAYIANKLMRDGDDEADGRD